MSRAGKKDTDSRRTERGGKWLLSRRIVDNALAVNCFLPRALDSLWYNTSADGCARCAWARGAAPVRLICRRSVVAEEVQAAPEVQRQGTHAPAPNPEQHLLEAHKLSIKPQGKEGPTGWAVWALIREERGKVKTLAVHKGTRHQAIAHFYSYIHPGKVELGAPAPRPSGPRAPRPAQRPSQGAPPRPGQGAPPRRPSRP